MITALGAFAALAGTDLYVLGSGGRLAVTGAADTVSTVLRQTIRQLVTPNHLRGRMTSVNMIFFMGGPQLGEMEAGVVARMIGAPLAVVTGGIGCLVAVVMATQMATNLLNYGRDSEKLYSENLPAR